MPETERDLPVVGKAQPPIAGQKWAELLRVIQKSWRDGDPQMLFEAVCRLMINDQPRQISDEHVARSLARCVEDCRGHVNRFIESTREAAKLNPRSAHNLVRNVTTFHNALDLCSVEELEDTFNAVLRLLCEAVYLHLPRGYKIEASLDEVEFRVRLNDAAQRQKNPWYTGHFVSPSIKADGPGQQTLRFNVACIHVAACNIKVPCFISLESVLSKDGGMVFYGTPRPHEVVDEFLTRLDRFSFQPSWIYMDRRFCSYGTLDMCFQYKRRKVMEGRVVDFLIPARRWGAAQSKVPLTARSIRSDKAANAYIKRRSTVNQMIRDGNKIAVTPMTHRSSWRFTVFHPDDPDAPYIPEGWTFTIINAPRKDVEISEGIEVHEDGSRSFGNWCTAPFTASTAYHRFKSYGRRNNIERVIQDFRSRLDFMRSPDIRIRVIGFGLGLCLLAIWALFRLRRGLELHRFEQGDYTFTMLLMATHPEKARALLRSLGAE